MSKLVTNDNLKAYHAELAEHIKLLQRNTAYVLDDIVNYDGMTFKCTTAGTTNTIKPNISSLSVGSTYTDGTCVWTRVDLDKRGIDYYVASKDYEVDDQVVYNNNIYRCITSHTSTATFDATKWTEISASGGVDLPEWQSNTSYTAGKYLVHEGTVYKVDNDFMSGTTFSDANLTSYIAPIMQGATSSASGQSGIVPKPNSTDVDKFLKGDGTWGDVGGGISIWQANTAYNVNDVVIDSNLIWQCATAHTSTTTFDESKWICISGGEISNGYEIVPLWEGVGNVLNQVLTLNDSYNNYDYILGTMADGAGVAFASNILETIFGNGLYIMGVLSSGGVKRAFLQFSSNQATILEATGLDSSKYISKLQGIRKAKPIVSSGMKYETLWEGEAGNLSGSGSTTITLNQPISKYQKLGFTIKTKPGTESTLYYREIDVDTYIKFIDGTLSTDHIGFYEGYSNFDDYVEINTSSTNTQVSFAYGNSSILNVIGISEGVQIPTGVQAARVTLFEGEYNTVNNSATVLPNTLQISDSIGNYDYLEFTINGFKSANENNYMTSIVDIKDITYNKASFRITASYYDHYSSFLCAFTDSTHFAICYNDKNIWTDGKITKIVGIKYIQPDSYSTEEKLIGTWIDGKPLYRKVFTPTGSGTSLIFESGLVGANYNVQKIFATVLDPANNILTIPFNDGSTRFTVYISYSTGTVHIETNQTNYTVKSVIVEYTKN